MRKPVFLKDWSIGQKTMASHLLVAALSILAATVLCYFFGYRYTRANALGELKRQVVAISRKESRLHSQGISGRGSVVDMYQNLTNSSVFFVNQDGDAVQMRRYEPSGTGVPKAELNGQESEGDVEYSTVELFDTIDRQFVDRVLAGEIVTAVQRFAFAEGVIVFAGAPITDAEGQVTGGVILAQPVEIMRAVSRELSLSLFVGSGIAILLAILLAIAQTRTLVRPIQKMTCVARKMAEGDYGHRVAIHSEDEIGELGRTLNTLSLRLLETIESLREERDRLELVISNIGEGILAVDREMRVIHSNLSFLELMELDSVEDLAKSQRPDVTALMDWMRRAIRTGESGKYQWLNPSRRAVLAEVTAVTDADDQLGAVCLLSDVSEAQRMEQLRRDYVANISHELRTPLTGIRGMIEPLMDGCVDTEEERQSCYSIIHKETVRLEKLVGEMLDLSRLQDGRIKVEMEPMELPGILEAAIRSMNPMAQEAGLSLNLETDGSPLRCWGNENRIMQVLIILLDNALDFTPRGGSVTVFARDAGRQVVVGVRDTGCGIEPKDIPLIWERFYKADRSRMRTKGTGLGLAIAKLAVELMGGTISVRSEIGAGSEFSFTLNK